MSENLIQTPKDKDVEPKQFELVDKKKRFSNISEQMSESELSLRLP
jgi:hypothetical protein